MRPQKLKTIGEIMDCDTENIPSNKKDIISVEQLNLFSTCTQRSESGQDARY